MKKCTRCKQPKHKSEFNKKSSNKDGLERYCKDCHRAKNRIHYQHNKDAYKASARKFKTKLRTWFRQLKTEQQCKSCGETKHWRLTFHHRNPKTKVSEISDMVSNNVSRNRILKEIKKCDVLCHNCHSDVHYLIRSQYNRALV